jgi:hypothetical protein
MGDQADPKVGLDADAATNPKVGLYVRTLA